LFLTVCQEEQQPFEIKSDRRVIVERLKEADMAAGVVTSKSGSQSEPFSVFKQKLGKQTSFKGFKHHFTSITNSNQEQKAAKTNKTSIVSADEKEEVIEEKRGFVPSDVLNDPSKKEFLTQLSKRMWMEKEKFLSKRRENGSIQESNSSNSLLQKIMTPAPVEYDTNSLKKKDPKKMFTDSSFYNSKYHPTIQDQVEMAHKLSSAMFKEQNKGTKGAKMYLTRMENSGGFGDDIPKHDNVPNMKLVMNPEGKVHLWDDLPADQRPDYQQIAVHAAPNLDIPEVKDPVAESLNAGIGKGEKSFYRPSTFVSAYRQVFDQNRGVFGSQAVLKTPESPVIMYKHSHTSITNNSPNNTKQSLSNENYKTFGDIQTDTKVCKIPESPKAPQRKQTSTSGTTVSAKTKPQPVTVNNPREKVNLKRHKSFHEDKNLTDQRKTKYFIEPSSNINVMKPSDVLKTPYLLPSSQNNYNNFPQINSTSMVSKTKALFEEKDRNPGFIPLGKSRTFSAFSTEIMKDTNGSECPLTPSVPKRKSSRNVFASYKSMNSNMNNCGMESMTTSPMTDRRIPMHKFF